MRKGRKTYAWGKPTMAVSTMCIKRGSDSPTWSILIIITNQLHSKTLTAAAGAFALPTRSQPAKLQQPNGTKDPQNQLTWASHRHGSCRHWPRCRPALHRHGQEHQHPNGQVAESDRPGAAAEHQRARAAARPRTVVCSSPSFLALSGSMQDHMALLLSYGIKDRWPALFPCLDVRVS